MSDSPLHNKTDLPTSQVLVEGTAISNTYNIESIVIEKGINKVSKAILVISDGDPAEENFKISDSDDFKPGKKIKIKLGYHNTEEDAFEGEITSHNIKMKSFGNKVKSQLILKCYDKALRMSLVKKTANFSEKKDSEVITSILGDYGLSKTVAASTYKHRNLIQYNCSDWDFMLSRADANGYIILNNTAKIEVLAPVFSSTAVLTLNHGVNVYSFEGEVDATSQLKSVSINSWDGTKLELNTGASTEPSVNAQGDLTGKVLGKAVGDPILELTTSAPEDTELIKSWAKANLQRSRLSKIKGSVSYPGSLKAQPGDLIELQGFGARFNGDAFVSAVLHDFREGDWVTETTIGLKTNEFLNQNNFTVPSALGLIPPITGIHTGLVKQIDEDPDGEYRVLVDVPVIELSGEGIWARLSSPYASEGIGSYFFPEIGTEVILGFLNDDPRYAIILGSLFGKKKKPPFKPEAKNEFKAIVTKSELKISFNDEKKIIVIETPGGQKATFDDDQKSLMLEDQNSNKIVLDSNGIILDSGKDITLKAKGAVKIDATTQVAIKAKTDVAIEGNNVSSKGKISFKAEGAASTEIKSSGTMTIKGTMVMIN